MNRVAPTATTWQRRRSDGSEKEGAWYQAQHSQERRQESREEGRKEKSREEGREEGRKEESREEGREEGCEEGRRKEGREEGRKAGGREEGREEGRRKEGSSQESREEVQLTRRSCKARRDWRGRTGTDGRKSGRRCREGVGREHRRSRNWLTQFLRLRAAPEFSRRGARGRPRQGRPLHFCSSPP